MFEKSLLSAFLIVSISSVAYANGSSTLTGDAIGMGRGHDDAYNNSYAKVDSILRAECAVLGGTFSSEQVDNEQDSDFGRYGYQVHLTMEAQCPTGQ